LFFEELNLPEATYNLDVGSGLHGEQTAKMLSGIEKILLTEIPDIVLVQGDTNTVLAGALAASKLHIKVGHVEAGLRSFDRNMPEEINRVLADHISDMLFAPTENSRELLLKEGIPQSRIFVTGNTVVDAVYQNQEIAKKKSDILKKFSLEENKYILVTAHREENVDVKEKLAGILEGLERIYNEFQLPILFPIHPRTEKRIKEFGLEIPQGVQPVSPQGYLDFLLLEASASLIVTDSGGLQEEACILKVPCVTLRDNTERPETIEVGANVLAGIKSENIFKFAKEMMTKERHWRNPFGDGDAAQRIIANLRIIT
jgi:UDP-N-acetylglucosamine 2-epimerase (non-hydrolysing)